MKDSHDRTIEYLRISVTDRCNLRCKYCMPETGVQPVPHDEILRFDEIGRIARVMAGLGVSRIRLTGGEPLVRLGIEHLAATLKSIEGIDFLGLTTNGVLLHEKAHALLDAGIGGVNISMDTTDPARYHALTGRNEFSAAMKGLLTAVFLPFEAVKINCVLSPYSRAADWLGVISLARDLPVAVRLIEWMPLAGCGSEVARMDEAMAVIAKEFGQPIPAARRSGGPARYFSLDGFAGEIGFIPSMTHSFCGECNRVRLTSTGSLKTCLFYDTGIPLKPLLRGGTDDHGLAQAILAAVLQKPERHNGKRQAADSAGKSLIDRTSGMFDIGG